MLLRVDCVIPDFVASILTVMLCSLHNSIILSLTAVPISINPPRILLIILYQNTGEKLNSKELTFEYFCDTI